MTGVFNPRWKTEFNSLDGETAWVNSTAAAVILIGIRFIYYSRLQIQQSSLNLKLKILPKTVTRKTSVTVGPVGAFIVDRCGCRWGTIIGSVIAMVGYVLSAFAKSVPGKFNSK